jgi:hypothetical protein
MESTESNQLRPRARVWRGLSHAALAIGGALIAIATVGEWTDLGDYASNAPRSWERFDSALVDRTRNLDDLFAAANERTKGRLLDLPPQRAMNVLFETTIDRFTHGASMHTPFSNWLLWALGKIHPALGAIREPGNLLKHGSSAFCSDSSYVLMRLALEAGIRPRHVGLYGHVVMEAWYDDAWHMYDPDFEVVASDRSGAILSVAALSRDKERVRQEYVAKLDDDLGPDQLIEIFTSRDNNDLPTRRLKEGT